MRYMFVLRAGMAAVLLSFLITGCNHFQDIEDDPVLARVGSEQLTLSHALSSIPDMLLSQDSLAALQNYQNRWIENKVMETEARRLGLDQDIELQMRLQRLKSQLLIEALRETLLDQHSDQLVVDDDEARNYYQENRDRFLLNERYVQIRHLRAVNRTDAVNARDAIMSGRNWEGVAREFSLDPDRQIRTSEQFIPESLAFPDNPGMQSMLDRIGITEISPIQQVGNEYQFVQLMDERPEGDHPDLDWLVTQISDWLHLEKSKRFINSYKRNLYLQADANNEIEIHDVGELDLSDHISTIEPE